MQMRTCTIHARVRIYGVAQCPSFAVIIAQADALPPSLFPSLGPRANCFLCRSFAKVSEEEEEKAEEMLAKDAQRSAEEGRLNGAKWMEMARKRAAALI